jgi:integrase/recombinase XerD
MQDITIYQPARDEQFIDLWLHGKSEKTIRAYTSEISRYYATTGKSLQETRLEDVYQFVDSLVHLAPASRNRALAAVKSALSFGVKSGYLKVNVGLLAHLPKLEDRLAERIMSEASVARMLALEANTRNHAILVLLYRAGLRCAELCNLTWRNLQERDEAGQITVFGKGDTTRSVLLTQETWQEVMNLKGYNYNPLDGYVFTSRQARSRAGKNDRRLDESMIFRIVRAAANRAGVALDEHGKSKMSPHWMRHAHATHALENGAPITLVKETLGHKSIETTAKYTHVRPNASSGQYLKV